MPVQLLFLALLTFIASVPAHAVNPKADWKDSYSQDGQCYCYTTYDHGIGSLLVDTPQGEKTVREVCEAIGPGPGVDGNPIYNDIQCGNGPANNVGDEDPGVCPGRTDLGADGCLLTGPTWNLDIWFPADMPEPDAEPESETQAEQEALAESEALAEPDPETETTTDADEDPANTATTTDNQTDTATVVEAGGDADALTGNVSTENAPASSPTPITIPVIVDPPGIIVEAERFSDNDLFWQVISPTVNFSDDDFWADSDDNHAATASEGAYLELLPDTRILANDPASTDSNWTEPGTGHRVEYQVSFVTPGQYAVQTLSWSTGTEDDTVFVGVNDVWATDANLVRICSDKNQWAWSGCALAERAVIDIPTAGVHTVVFSGSEDGFEMDKFALTRTGDATPALGAAVSTGGRENFTAIGGLSYAIFTLLGVFLCRRKPG